MGHRTKDALNIIFRKTSLGSLARRTRRHCISRNFPKAAKFWRVGPMLCFAGKENDESWLWKSNIPSALGLPAHGVQSGVCWSVFNEQHWWGRALTCSIHYPLWCKCSQLCAILCYWWDPQNSWMFNNHGWEPASEHRRVQWKWTEPSSHFL